jgi:hypothetical protein
MPPEGCSTNVPREEVVENEFPGYFRFFTGKTLLRTIFSLLPFYGPYDLLRVLGETPKKLA